MRIVRFFFRWIVILGGLGLIVYVFGGQLILAFGSRPFLADMRRVEESRLSLPSYNQRCRTSAGASPYSAPQAIQLRFLDDHEYQIELRCSLSDDMPIILSTGALPALLTKLPGNSGFFVDLQAPSRSELTIQSLMARKTFVVDTTIQFSDGRSAVAGAPVTTCEGWGYQCCNPDEEKGIGTNQDSGVSDCDAHCFAACSPIPAIQSFSSDPYPSGGSTIRMEGDSLLVTFSYHSQVLGGEIANVHIDFGDGSGADSTQPIGSFSHLYTCPEACLHTATISASDDRGNSSVVNDANKLYIKRN